MPKRKTILLVLLYLIGCKANHEADPIVGAESAYFIAIAKNDVPLQAPAKGEWLFDHPEKGQSFEAYTSAKPALLSDSVNTIYLKPIGTFTTQQQQALALTKQYLTLFFQTKVVLLDNATDSLVPAYAKRLRENDNWQLRAPYVLDSMLMGKAPANAIAYMAFTAKDLYPADDWNYVFGQASYAKRVGVSSVFRLQPATHDSNSPVIFLRRLLNIASHEVGHMFTISHCTAAKCVMNGANSLYETDKSPNRLCSECQKKLYWNIRYNNKKRLDELCQFFIANGLMKDYSLLLADLESVNGKSLSN